MKLKCFYVQLNRTRAETAQVLVQKRGLGCKRNVEAVGVVGVHGRGGGRGLYGNE